MVARQPFCAAIVAPADLRLQNVRNFATGKFFAQVASVATLIAQLFDHAYRHAHIGKKPH